MNIPYKFLDDNREIVFHRHDYWQSAHKPGFTTFLAVKIGLRAELNLFMAADTEETDHHF